MSYKSAAYTLYIVSAVSIAPVVDTVHTTIDDYSLIRLQMQKLGVEH